jgi:hypothetical protein
VWLGPDELRAHLHVMGLTGQGKSKLLAHLATELILQGRPCGVLDPHSDLVLDILRLLLQRGFFRRPAARRQLLYLDFTRRDAFVPFNVLRQPYPVDRIASHLVEACMRAWPALDDGQAPQFENVLLAGATVLVANDLPLTALTRLLTDRPYREQLLVRCPDAQVVAFFHDRFDRWGREAPLLIESTLRRAFLLSYSPALRNTLGQRENLLNFRALMDEQVSVLINLGGLDEQAQRLLGALITVGFESAALSRADLAEPLRMPYQLVLDEFSMFSAQSEEALARVLSLARKYAVYLVLAHQSFSQLSARIAGALQNTNRILFKLGRDDSVWAAPRMGSYEPLAVKHTVEDERAEPRTHPVFYSVQETYEGWAKALEQLRPREAYARLGDRTVNLRTPTVPAPRTDAARVERLVRSYAAALLVPADRVVQGSTQRSPSGVAPSLSLLARDRNVGAGGATQGPDVPASPDKAEPPTGALQTTTPFGQTGRLLNRKVEIASRQPVYQPAHDPQQPRADVQALVPRAHVPRGTLHPAPAMGRAPLLSSFTRRGHPRPARPTDRADHVLEN